MAARLGLVALALSLVQTGSVAGGAGEWWEGTLIYQIWPRAFQDSDGDGNGDLIGILQRLDYLEDLGVETICLNPIYPSPMIASGYDISNYTDIDPIFGDIWDFDVLIDSAHRRGMKVILDVVPNHSSNKHTWFNESITRIDPYTDYYVWADGGVDADGLKHPPNNWANFMGHANGSAWTWNEARGQWYYHKYLESQPDLNLRNEEVVKEILNIIHFWLEHRVDGFLISDVPYLFENPDLTDERPSDSFESPETSNLLHLIREYTNNWTEVNNSTSKLVLAEAWNSDENLISYYGSAENPGAVPQNFRFIEGVKEDVNAKDIKRIVQGWLEKLEKHWTTNWPLSTDKHPRIATRVGVRKLQGYLTLSMLLPGQAYTYYGDEIGMTDSNRAWNDSEMMISPLLSSDSVKKYSHSGPRTPMQWNGATSAGFSTNDTTYLPVNENYDYQNVERQLEDPESTLNTYKWLARLRKEPVFGDGDWEINTMNGEQILVIKRSLDKYPTYVIFINTGSERESVDISSLYPDLGNLIVVLSTGDSSNNLETVSERVNLLPDAAMVLRTSGDEGTTGEPPVAKLKSVGLEGEPITWDHLASTVEKRHSSISRRVLKDPEDKGSLGDVPRDATLRDGDEGETRETSTPEEIVRLSLAIPKSSEDEESSGDSPADKTMQSEVKHNRNNLRNQFLRESEDTGDGEVTDDSPTDHSPPEIDETPLDLNNSKEIREKPAKTSRAIHYTSEGVQTSTTVTPRLLDNSVNEYGQHSSAYSNKIVNLVPALVAIATLVLNYL